MPWRHNPRWRYAADIGPSVVSARAFASLRTEKCCCGIAAFSFVPFLGPDSLSHKEHEKCGDADARVRHVSAVRRKLFLEAQPVKACTSRLCRGYLSPMDFSLLPRRPCSARHELLEKRRRLYLVYSLHLLSYPWPFANLSRFVRYLLTTVL